MSEAKEGQAEALRMFSVIARIRSAEELLQAHIQQHGFGGFWHPGIGQEGVQAGAVLAMDERDYLFYAHRGLGYVVARGMSWPKIFGDLFGKASGSTAGKGGGTIHFADPDLGIMGQGGTLGSNFVLGAGTALASQLLKDGRVTLVFFGEGAAARGTFHEAALSASAWKLPVVWICENNEWALSAPFAEQNPTPNIADRAAAYGIPGVIVDGQDPFQVHAAAAEAMARARSGDGPTLIEAKTIRVRGHYEGDQQRYREGGLGSRLAEDRDPLAIAGRDLAPDTRRQILEAAAVEVREALDTALNEPGADPAVLYSGLWA